MKKNTIAVCDSEAGYAGTLAEYLNNRKKLPFRAEAFTDPEKFCQYAGINHPEFLLIAEENFNSQVQALQIPYTIVLASDREPEHVKQKCIYKYQSAESLIREVMAYCQESVFPDAGYGYKKKIQLIGIYSPLGRCGKTLFALTAGQIWGESRNVLYLNMEDYSGWKDFSEEDTSQNLSALFYHLRQGKIFPPLTGLVHSWGNLDYIPPVSSFEDLRNISYREWTDLFTHLEKESSYQLLVRDIGNGIDQLFSILDLCTQIYMPVLDDWVSKEKLEQFKKIAFSLSDTLGSKIQELRLPFTPCAEKGQDFPKNLLWGKWGTDIRKILEVKAIHE